MHLLTTSSGYGASVFYYWEVTCPFRKLLRLQYLCCQIYFPGITVLFFFYTHLWKDEIIINHISKAVMLKFYAAVVCSL